LDTKEADCRPTPADDEKSLFGLDKEASPGRVMALMCASAFGVDDLKDALDTALLGTSKSLRHASYAMLSACGLRWWLM
jgi:hypothetical protein